MKKKKGRDEGESLYTAAVPFVFGKLGPARRRRVTVCVLCLQAAASPRGSRFFTGWVGLAYTGARGGD